MYLPDAIVTSSISRDRDTRVRRPRLLFVPTARLCRSVPAPYWHCSMACKAYLPRFNVTFATYYTLSAARDAGSGCAFHAITRDMHRTRLGAAADLKLGVRT